MSEWRGPVGRMDLVMSLLCLVGLLLVFAILFHLVDDGSLLVLGLETFLYLLFAALLYFGTYLRAFRGIVCSRWDMDEDVVARRIVTAMMNRGVRVVMTRSGESYRFPFPSVQIVVRPGRSRALVYIGPLTDDNHDKVGGLKAFVDGVLGQGR